MLATINVKINDVWSEIPAIKGENGIGVPTGGTTGQVLSKVSNSDYDTEWVDQTTGDIPTKTSDLINDSGFISSIPSEYITESELNGKGYITEYTETDPTVPDWAKAETKPSYDYSEISGTPTIPTVPTNLSSFTDDVGYLQKSGGTMTGSLIASYSATGGQVRNIYASTSEPSTSDGIDGDIWIIYEG